MTNDVGGSPRNIGNDGSKLSNKTVEKSRFSDIGRSNKSNVHKEKKEDKADNLFYGFAPERQCKLAETN
jgi:hypothetical protein